MKKLSEYIKESIAVNEVKDLSGESFREIINPGGSFKIKPVKSENELEKQIRDISTQFIDNYWRWGAREWYHSENYRTVGESNGITVYISGGFEPQSDPKWYPLTPKGKKAKVQKQVGSNVTAVFYETGNEGNTPNIVMTVRGHTMNEREKIPADEHYVENFSKSHPALAEIAKLIVPEPQEYNGKKWVDFKFNGRNGAASEISEALSILGNIKRVKMKPEKDLSDAFLFKNTVGDEQGGRGEI